MPFSLDILFENGYSMDFQCEQPTTFMKARQLIVDRIRRGGVSLTWGPPGTGKTTTFLSSIEVVLPQLVDGPETLIYIAPTNKLVADTYVKLAAIFKKFALKKNDFLKHVKVYGSQFKIGSVEFLKQIKKPDEDTKIILTTAYQAPYLPSIKGSQRIHIIVDEASKSPLHVPFIPLTEELLHYLSSSEERFSSLNIIGDPNQAIGVDELKGRKDLLLFLRTTVGLLGISEPNYENIQDILDLAKSRLSGSYLSILEVTYRLPHPSEQPISHGFYNAVLRSRFEASEVLKDVWRQNQANQLISHDEVFKKVTTVLEDAITTERPIIYIHQKERPYQDVSGELVDLKRAIIGLYFATALAHITGESVSVITVYSDQAHYMKIRFNSEFRNLIAESPNVSFLTTHKALGSEDNHVVAVLGKEYYPSTALGDETIYYQEPEVLNVQLSRHKKTLIIIGNFQRMINTISKIHSKYGHTRYRNLKTTAEELLNLCGVEISGQRLKKISTGDGGVFHQWE